MKLWEKDESRILKIVEEFEVGKDYIYDREIATYDVIGTIAHVKMLNKIGILSDEERDKVVVELEKLLQSFKENLPSLKVEDEDIHTYIENYIVSKLGDLGKKIHTGRSRNDQVLTALRLYEKDKINQIIQKLTSLIQKLKHLSDIYLDKPLIGYTHLKQAMPTTVDTWINSFAEALDDDRKLLGMLLEFIDRNPLGSSAGYGFPIKLDRDFTTKALGFSDFIRNHIYAQNTRGKYESFVIFALTTTVSDISRFANDVILFSSDEFGFIKLGKEITTGSSIMPHKKNPDVFELMRAKSKKLLGYLVSTIGITSSLPSGYSKDLQETKETIIEAINETTKILDVLEEIVEYIHFDEEAVFSKMKKDIFSVDIAVSVMEKFNIPFRDAYRKVGSTIEKYQKTNAKDTQDYDEIEREIVGYLEMDVKELYNTMITKRKQRGV